MILYQDKKYNFIEIFNEKTGFLMRSNIIINGYESDVPASIRSFPELIDIGIMGHCHAATSGICKQSGVDCYQDALNSSHPNMSIKTYKTLLHQCKGKVFQVALGGAGDPNKHEDFNEILKATRAFGIIPNLTTSGFNLTDKEIELIKKYCGAVAVSFYSRLDKQLMETNNITIQSIEHLLAAGCKVNIHYILSIDSIDEALYRIKNNLFPEGIHAVVFLLYKPVGAANCEKVLNGYNKKYIELLQYIQSNKLHYRIGFDTCQTPALLRFCPNLCVESMDMCEAGRFSMYINNNSIAYPCSFGYQHSEYAVDLQDISIEDAWNSKKFVAFRERQENMCCKCGINNCYGCALNIDLNMCGIINNIKY
ncbi:MAG: pyrroloquinoline quinone biosynthesis protein PqqE [Pelotomaculum sp. PtaU1.Bin065]|nr:MAG: pyrroloquinoline quinone biosynthesis protein PqqE [Pelotomaculum sp. PtaU1.Bin065]